MKLGSIFLRIADIDFSILSVDPTLALKVDGVSQKFLTSDIRSPTIIETRWDDLSSFKGGEKIFDSNSLWQLYQNNGTYLFSFNSSTFGPHPYKVCRAHKDFTSAEVSLHRPYFNRDNPVYPLEYPLDELLLINLLALGRGVEIHGCGVVDPAGEGHLFIGQSGAGKTTIARLWQDTLGVTILSDDRIILRQIDKKLWMYGTPWHGEAMFAFPDRAPLTRIYFLEKDSRNELVSLRDPVALGRLITCSFIPFYSQPGVEFTLDFFEQVVQAVPCCELRFVPDKRVVDFIQDESNCYPS